MRLGLLPALLLALAATPALAESPDLRALNREVNRTYPLANRPLAWSAEGRPGYDCKGFVYLKIIRLLAEGVPADRMTVLITGPKGTPVAHAVLLVGDKVLDNMSPWLNSIRDYHVLSAWSATQWTANFEGGGPTEGPYQP